MSKRQAIICPSKIDALITCDLTDVPASNYDREMDARPFDTINDILRFLSLVQYLLKGRNGPIWSKREPNHMRLSGTDRLIVKMGYLRVGLVL